MSEVENEEVVDISVLEKPENSEFYEYIAVYDDTGILIDIGWYGVSINKIKKTADGWKVTEWIHIANIEAAEKVCRDILHFLEKRKKEEEKEEEEDEDYE